ncbi:hypothetical protein BC777_0111 [Yoonia maricola]|uniref:Uncharacterized protein n=1 Tax=Yoonia maricola TaxID=420999 RepID=A0A2M8WK69_9RHOB|nr:hypothetical protein BC777_0111 [Yoonia maricola]
MTAPSSHNVTNESTDMKTKSYKVGRSAKTGRFTTVKKAKRLKSTHVVETIKTSK